MKRDDTGFKVCHEPRMDKQEILGNLETILDTIARAAREAERAAADVTLTAVSKTHGADKIQPLLEHGHRVFGENRVQEAAEKWPLLQAQFPDIELRLIGPLQSNKAKQAVALFNVIETVDRPKIARALAAEMASQHRHLPVFVQVNTGEEAQKAGVLPADAAAFVQSCQHDYKLDVIGLMAIPPVHDHPAPHFALLKKLASAAGLPRLSMGMSADYEVGISLGATDVRVGSALFGTRG